MAWEYQKCGIQTRWKAKRCIKALPKSAGFMAKGITKNYHGSGGVQKRGLIWKQFGRRRRTKAAWWRSALWHLRWRNWKPVTFRSTFKNKAVKNNCSNLDILPSYSQKKNLPVFLLFLSMVGNNQMVLLTIQNWRRSCRSGEIIAGGRHQYQSSVCMINNSTMGH